MTTEAIVAILSGYQPNTLWITIMPAIHDITTSPEDPPAYVAIVPLRANAHNSMEYGAGRGMTPEKLARLTREAYPDIVPQYFDESPQWVFDQALSAAKKLGWKIIAAEPEEGRIEAVDTTFWLRFKDDIIILITQEGEKSVLNARSLSRIGTHDFGANAKRLRKLFQLLHDSRSQ